MNVLPTPPDGAQPSQKPPGRPQQQLGRKESTQKNLKKTQRQNNRRSWRSKPWNWRILRPSHCGPTVAENEIFRRPAEAASTGLGNNWRDVSETKNRGTKGWNPREAKKETPQWDLTNNMDDTPPERETT